MRYRLLFGFALLIGALGGGSQMHAHAPARPALTPTAGNTPTATITPTCTTTPVPGNVWRTVPIPDGGGLYGVAVSAPDDVWVGGVAGRLQHWNGTDWTAAPLPTTTTGPALVADLAAAAPGDVWAVTEGRADQLFHRAGSGWTAVPYPLPSGTHLVDLSAFSPTGAWVVGSSEPVVKQIVPLVEYWDGHTWTTVATSPAAGPQGGGPMGDELRQVQAVGPSEAWAIGGGIFSNSSPNLLLHCTPAGCTSSREFEATALAADGPADVWTGKLTATGTDFHHWNGSTWTLVIGPALGSVVAMTAFSPTDAWALGSANLAHWDGQVWTIVPHPPAFLLAIAGSGGDNVWAVGKVDGSIGAPGVVQRYGPELTPTAGPTLSATGTAIGSTATPTGTAIGSTVSAPATAPPITLTPGGSATATESATTSLTVTPTALPSYTPPVCGLGWRSSAGVDLGALAAVAAISPNDVWAGGSHGLEHWNGTAWTTVPISGTTGIYSLSAVNAHDVWALSSRRYSVLSHWDGHTWLDTPYPHPPPTVSLDLVAVVADGPQSVWLLGSVLFYGDWFFEWLTHWNGSQWTVIEGGHGSKAAQAPHGACFSGEGLQRAAVVGPDDVWVAGNYVSICAPPEYYSYVRHCTSVRCSGEYLLNADVVAGSASNDVWAAGVNSFYHWDGTAWTRVDAPPVGAITAITARAPDDAWAVGNNTILHWNGTAWSVIGLQASNLAAVSADAADDVWAVGADAVGHSVIQHYSGAPFPDVAPSNVFFAPIQALVCRTILGGYTCGGAGEPCDSDRRPYFRPANLVTRGQTAKIVSLAAALPGTASGQHFSDVPPSNVFYPWIEQMAAAGILSSYTCGTIPSEPCDSGHRPYFRPATNVTRGQLAKIIALAGGYHNPPSGQTFADVLPDNVFYTAVEQVAGRGIISGYTCGGVPSEPCDSGHRPYYRPAVTASRGQSAKIVNQAFPAP